MERIYLSAKEFQNLVSNEHTKAVYPSSIEYNNITSKVELEVDPELVGRRYWTFEGVQYIEKLPSEE